MVGQRNRLERVACTPFDRDCHNLPSSELKERLFGCTGKWCNIIEVPILSTLTPRTTSFNCLCVAWRCWNWNGVVGPRGFALGLLGGYPRRISHTILSTDLREFSNLISWCEQ